MPPSPPVTTYVASDRNLIGDRLGMTWGVCQRVDQCSACSFMHIYRNQVIMLCFDHDLARVLAYVRN